MKHFMATLILASLGTAVLILSGGQAQLMALDDSVAKNECSSKCQGDFPTSSDRKYASADTARIRA